MDIGLTLPNRGVLLGVTTSDQMLDLAETADQIKPSLSFSIGRDEP